MITGFWPINRFAEDAETGNRLHVLMVRHGQEGQVA
jgi:hypothetical protein